MWLVHKQSIPLFIYPCSWEIGPSLFYSLISSALWALIPSHCQHTLMEINRQRNNNNRSESFSFVAWCVFLPSGSSQLLLCLCLAHPICQGPAFPLLGPCSSSLRSSGRFTSVGCHAWMLREMASLSPWPCGGCLYEWWSILWKRSHHNWPHPATK